MKILSNDEWSLETFTFIQRFLEGNRGISEFWYRTTVWSNHIYEILRFALDDN